MKSHTKNSKSFTTTRLLVVIIVIVILVVALLLLNRKQTEELPNYTEITGDFTVTDLELDKQPSMGSKDAVIKIVEFGDFKCPACANWAQGVFPLLKSEYIDNGKAEFFFINMPFIDRDSIQAASAGEAVRVQNNDKFWEFYEKLYANQGDETKVWATKSYLKQFVKDNINGLDYDKFNKELDSGLYDYDTRKDFKTATYYGVNGTPRIMINDELVEDYSFEGIKAYIADLDL